MAQVATLETEQEVSVKLPNKLIPVFQGPARYRGAKGGRGSGKTFSFAKMTAVFAYFFAEMGVEGVILCGREHLNSLEDSSLAEVKAAIRSEKWLNDYFDIGEKYIRTKNRRVKYIFAGLKRNLDSIKSKSRILIAWVDEAEGISQMALNKLIPTVREEGAVVDEETGRETVWNSEIWFTWNPENEANPVNVRFGNLDNLEPNAKIIELNYTDSYWFPKVLDDERLYDLENRPDVYPHIWEGAYLEMTDAQIFKGKILIEEFTPQSGGLWKGPYQGLDFGFSQVPLSAHRYWIHDDNIHCEYEAYSPSIEIDDTYEFILDTIPNFDKYVAYADSAEPKSISYLRRNGLPKILPVKKWPNSVKDGLRVVLGYKKLIIHPRCTGAQSDFKLYSYKRDPMTEKVTSIIIDADNHSPDDMRYALSPVIKHTLSGKTNVKL